MLETIMLSENEDIPRFIELIDGKIKNKELKKYKNWEATKNNIKPLPDESEEVQKQQEAEFKALAQNILAKYHTQQTDFFDVLEKKYGGNAKIKGKGKGKGKGSEYEIGDEAFEKIQKERLQRNQTQSKGAHDNSRKKLKK